jgi:hypothetical protein
MANTYIYLQYPFFFFFFFLNLLLSDYIKARKPKLGTQTCICIGVACPCVGQLEEGDQRWEVDLVVAVAVGLLIHYKMAIQAI